MRKTADVEEIVTVRNLLETEMTETTDDPEIAVVERTETVEVGMIKIVVVEMTETVEAGTIGIVVEVKETVMVVVIGTVGEEIIETVVEEVSEAVETTVIAAIADSFDSLSVNGLPRL